MGLMSRTQQTKLEALIGQKIPAASVPHSEGAIVLDLPGPQPGVVALLQLRSELMLDGWIN
jgi:hypothetical protein